MNCFLSLFSELFIIAALVHSITASYLCCCTSKQFHLLAALTVFAKLAALVCRLAAHGMLKVLHSNIRNKEVCDIL